MSRQPPQLLLLLRWSLGRSASYITAISALTSGLRCCWLFVACFCDCFANFTTFNKRQRRGDVRDDATCCCACTVNSAEHGGSGARTVQTAAGAAVAARAATAAAAAAWCARIQWTASPTGDEDVQGLQLYTICFYIYRLITYVYTSLFTKMIAHKATADEISFSVVCVCSSVTYVVI